MELVLESRDWSTFQRSFLYDVNVQDIVVPQERG